MRAAIKATGKPDLSAFVGRDVRVVIDRPLGSAHPRHPDLIYPVNYGCLPGTVSGDGQEIDAYVLGADVPLPEATGRVVAVILRADDAEDKLIVAVNGARFSAAEIAAAVAFQERFFRSRVLMGENDAPETPRRPNRRSPTYTV